MSALLCVLAAVRARFHDEAGLQAAIAAALEEAGVSFTREARLAPRDRIDFLIGDVGVEVKVDGAPIAVLRQLQRYADHRERVKQLVLVTTRPQLAAVPQTIGGCPLVAVLLQSHAF